MAARSSTRSAAPMRSACSTSTVSPRPGSALWRARPTHARARSDTERRTVGFFAEFHAWLNAILTGYIADNTALIAGALEPAIVTLGVLYVMVWGYLQLTGQIEEPFIVGVKR